MKKRLWSIMLALCMVITALPVFAAGEAEEGPAEAAADPAARQMEYLNRGGFASTHPSGGVYLSWRLLGTEPMNTAFKIYKNGAVLVESYELTNYTDPAGTADDKYAVAPVIGGVEGTLSDVFPMLEGHVDGRWTNSPYAYFDIPLQIPEDGVDYTYNEEDSTAKGKSGGPNDASVGDVDGDGEYEVILKWNPSNAKDSAGGGVTGNVYIDCYEYDGTLLWRIDLGRNIRAGAHYTQFQVFDYDGDGKAEMAVKTAPGSIDGKGNYVSDAGNTDEIRNTDNEASYIGSNGHITGGPEYLTIFNGESGAAMQTINYHAPVGNVRDWGDSNYNRSDRFLAGTAYLDGVHPSLIECRGYYGKSVVAAYTWDGKDLKQSWIIDSTSSSSNDFYGQGNHNLSVADLDNDGKDEIIYGSAALDDNGKVLWSAKNSSGRKLGHGDALHVSDFDNDGEQEVFKVLEDEPTWGRVYINGKDGKVLWHETSTSDDGRGLMAYMSPKYGVLAWDSGHNIRTLDGTVVNNSVYQDNKWSLPNSPIYWDGDLYREHFDGKRIQKWNDYDAPDADGNLGSIGRLWELSGINYNNDSKKNPCLQADLFGDWREELILRTVDNTALRVFTSLTPSDYKFTTFMHDSQYRCAIAWQNTGYNQPPHQSYYIGYDKDVPDYVQPNIYVKDLDPEVVFTVTDEAGNPAAGVSVSVGGASKVTDKDGVVSLRIPAGTYIYTAESENYNVASGEITVADGQTNSVTVKLSEIPDSVITVTSGGSPVSGASVMINKKTVKSGADGKITIKLRAGEYDYTAECRKYNTKTGKLTVAENGSPDLSIELEAIDYVYDSDKDANGSKFVYSGGEGAALSFSGGQWTFAQNSTDGGRKFGGDFDMSDGGNMTFEMTYNTGGVKDTSGNWNWAGRTYTHHIEFLDYYGKVLLGISQEYKESGAQEVQYYTGTKSKTAVKSGTVVGGPNITARSASTWTITLNADLKNKTAELRLMDEAGENGYIISDIPIDVTTFSRVEIGSTASGNVTWSPKVSKVLYKSDCISASTPVPPTATPEPTPTPAPIPMKGETWNFNNIDEATTYEDGAKIANENGESLTVNYSTKNTAPSIAKRADGDNYFAIDDKGAGQDGWTYTPESPIDSELIVVEEEFKMGDADKDTVLLRLYDNKNASTSNTYTDKNDGRAFEIKTGAGTLKFSDYFSKGSSDTKGLDQDVSGFTFEKDKWYGIKVEYAKADNSVTIYTKPDGGAYTKRNTFTLGSGTNKGDVPALAPTGFACSTRGSAANVLGIDNIYIGYASSEPEPTATPDETVPTETPSTSEPPATSVPGPTQAPATEPPATLVPGPTETPAASEDPKPEYAYTINSVTPSLEGETRSVNVNITKNLDAGEGNQLIVAAYNADGVMTAVKMGSVSAEVGETVDVNISIAYGDGDIVIAYVWNSLSEVKPLADPYKLK